MQHSKTGHLSFTSIRAQDTFKSNCNRPQTPHTVFPGNQPVDFSICTFTEIHTFGLIDIDSQIQDTFIEEPEEILYNNIFYPKQIEFHLKIQKWCVFMQRRHRSSRDETHQHDSYTLRDKGQWTDAADFSFPFKFYTCNIKPWFVFSPPTIRIPARVCFSAFQAVTGFLQDLIGQLLDVAPRSLDVM